MSTLGRRIQRIERAMGTFGGIPEKERFQIIEHYFEDPKDVAEKRIEERKRLLARRYGLSPETISKEVLFVVITEYARKSESSPQTTEGNQGENDP